MIGKSPIRTSPVLFRPLLSVFFDRGFVLELLADFFDWLFFEREFAPLYSMYGRMALPIRMMGGCLMLLLMFIIVDVTLTSEGVMFPYMLYFCGVSFFQLNFPFDSSVFVLFR